MIKSKEKKYLKTFSIHEKDLSLVHKFTHIILQYKHLENILNLLIAHEFNNKDNKVEVSKQKSKEMFSLLLNKIIMKAVLKSNPGGEKTSYNIAQVNNYFNSQHVNFELFNQAKLACFHLNDKNIGEIVGRLHKDWSNFFVTLKKFNSNKSNNNLQKPSYPKPKKLSKVYNYSVPLEVSKFSMAKADKGLLGINLGNKMVYVKFFNFNKDKFNGNKPKYLNKKINSVTVSLSHGHIYYNLQYIDEKQNLKDNIKNKDLDNFSKKEENSKIAGLDIGINNIASIFVNDNTTKSIIISGKELISYNCNFNKRLSKINEEISNEVIQYKEIINKQGNKQLIPEKYSQKGKLLQNRKSQLFERRKLYMDDYMQKLSKKITNYLCVNKVDSLVISRNLSFTKTTGEIKMVKKTKQKFYQIPFGRLLNLIKSKLTEKEINIVEINEAYTSKTSSLTGDIVKVQAKSKGKKEILPNDLNGSRGSKIKGNLNNPLGRGLFKDMVINKIINADINAAVNHIKVGIDKLGYSNIKINKELSKYCNPIKIKSNHEFDKLLKTYQIVDIQKV
jgi:IS605 OrfB family transposase